MSHQKPKSDSLFIPRGFLLAPALMAIKSPYTIRVLLRFYGKRQVQPEKSSKKNTRWVDINDGQIEYTYDEAVYKDQMSRSTFSRAIKELSDLGFIDVTYQGNGLQHDKSKYRISDRWRLYGTDDFQPPKPLSTVNRGFQKGNRYGRNSCSRVSVIDEHKNVFKSEHYGEDRIQNSVHG